MLNSKNNNKETHFIFESDNENYGITPVENAFITLFMPRANGDYVKVYLYGLKSCYSTDAVPVDNASLSQELGITEADVRRAWEYWQEQGILSVSYDENDRATVTYYNILSIVLNGRKPHASKSQDTSTTKSATDTPPDNPDDNPRVAAMFEKIQLMFGSEPLSLTSMMTVRRYLTEDGFDPETVIVLVEYSINALTAKGESFSQQQAFRYMDAIAKSWAAQGVVTYEDAEAVMASDNARQKRYYRILKYLGITRNPMQRERNMIDRWFDEWHFDDDIVAEALRRTTKPTVNYTNGILQKWHDKGLTTLEAVQAEGEAFRQQRKHRQDAEQPPQDPDDLEDTLNREKMLDESFDEDMEAIWRSVDAKQ